MSCAINQFSMAHQWRNGAENICPERLISPLGGCTGTRQMEETKEKFNSFTRVA